MNRGRVWHHKPNMAPTKIFLRYVLAGVFLCTISVQAQPLTSPKITQLERSANGWSLTWAHDAPDTEYTVQFQETLEDGIWRIPQGAKPFPIPGHTWTDLDAGQAMRFYRVVGVPAAERGNILSINHDNTASASLLQVLINQQGVPITAQYNVRMYTLVYETITPMGARTVASGALFLPENTGGPLPLVSYQHGTIIEINKAPSALDLTTEASIGLIMATTGYATVLPDYLGLGDSPGLHPYHHARSEATVCVDLLRATRTFCATNGFPLNDRLFLTGYSQGGHATMALCRELETFHSDQFPITACAPMAGAYDLSGVTASDFLSPRTKPNPYYFLYLVGAYQEVYKLAPTLADLLAPPYNTTLPPLLEGNSSGGQINSAMPANPIEILKPELLSAFQNNPRHPLRLALHENDLYRWRPKSPMRMYHCSGDQDVIIANSQVAHASFQAQGATQVELVDPLPGASHGGCAQPAMLAAKAWFDSMR